MNIVVIDEHTLNPGDLDLGKLKTLGNLKVYARSEGEEVYKRLRDADIAVVNKVTFNKELIDRLPRLQYISVTATGYNNIDIDYLREKGILASNVTNYGSYAVAQHAFALLLELTNQVAHHHQECIDGRWNETKDFCFWSRPMTELYGKTMGVIGLGNIGLQAAKLATAFGMDVIYSSRSDKNIDQMTYAPTPKEVIQQSDVVSLHCSLNEHTKHLINSATLKHFKPHAFLINTSRGGLIDEGALIDALDCQQLAGAGLDVLSVEPPQTTNPLIHHKKCFVTPHNAWSSRDTRQRLLDIAIENIESFIQGQPKNLIT